MELSAKLVLPQRCQADDIRRQKNYYNATFFPPGSSTGMQSTPDLREAYVPHLVSFAYPWDTTGTVSVFGVIMKNSYHIFAIGTAARPRVPGQRAPPDIVHLLYVTKASIFEETEEQIQIYREKSPTTSSTSLLVVTWVAFTLVHLCRFCDALSSHHSSLRRMLGMTPSLSRDLTTLLCRAVGILLPTPL